MIIYLKLLMTAFFWGGTFIAGRMLAHHVPPFSAAFLRFVVASVVLVGFTYRIEGGFPHLSTRQKVAILCLGVSGIFFYNCCFFYGLERISAGRAALIIATNPIFISIFSAFLLQEKISPRKATGILFSTIGAFVVISKGSPETVFSGQLGWGELFILGCVLSWTTFSLIGKMVIKRLSPLVSITCASISGTLLLALPAIQEGLFQHLTGYSIQDWGCLFYLGVCGTAIGFVWYYEGIRQIGAVPASQFINFVPISAVVLAFFILGEPITLSLAVGAACILSGVTLMNTAAGRPVDRP